MLTDGGMPLTTSVAIRLVTLDGVPMFGEYGVSGRSSRDMAKNPVIPLSSSEVFSTIDTASRNNIHPRSAQAGVALTGRIQFMR